MPSSPPMDLGDTGGGGSKHNTYFLVPSLKSIITHKLISFIYEDNLTFPLHTLNADILEYMTARMPFCVIYRVYQLKLAGDAIGLDFLKKYADSNQFIDETRNLIVKQLKIKHETKIGLWTAFRRGCIRNPNKTSLFWKEFSKREREVARREIAKRALNTNGKTEEDSGKKDRHELRGYGGKQLAEWGKKGKGGGVNRKMMFHEYYDLVESLGTKYSIENIPLFLINKIEDGVNERVLRDLETEIKSFILKMKILTNDFLPLERQCTTYAPLPIWIKPSPLNKDHKYIRSRTKLILLQRQSSAETLPSSPSPFSSSATSPSTSSSSLPSSSSSSPSSSSSSSPSSSASSSSSSFNKNAPPPTFPAFPDILSTFTPTTFTSANVTTPVTAAQTRKQLDAMDFGVRKARKALREVLKKGGRSTHSEGEEESSEDSGDEGAKDYYINCDNTQADHRAHKAG